MKEAIGAYNMIKKSYKPLLTRPHSWQSILDWYIKLNSLPDWDQQPMIKILGYIFASGLYERLHAVTSHQTLVLSIYNPMELNRETLRITYDESRQSWLFQYRALPEPLKRMPEWVRECSKEQGIDKFKAFLKRMHWN